MVSRTSPLCLRVEAENHPARQYLYGWLQCQSVKSFLVIQTVPSAPRRWPTPNRSAQAAVGATGTCGPSFPGRVSVPMTLTRRYATLFAAFCDSGVMHKSRSRAVGRLSIGGRSHTAMWAW